MSAGPHAELGRRGRTAVTERSGATRSCRVDVVYEILQ